MSTASLQSIVFANQQIERSGTERGAESETAFSKEFSFKIDPSIDNFLLTNDSSKIVASEKGSSDGISSSWKEVNSNFSFSSKTVMPESYGAFGSVAGAIGPKLVLGGGSNYPDLSRSTESGLKFYKKLYVLEKGPEGIPQIILSLDLPENRSFSASVETPSGLAVLGGENESGLLHSGLLLVWSSDSDSMTIQSLPDLPVAVTRSAGAFFNDRIWLIGGRTVEGVTNSVYTLDPKKPESGWRQEEPFPLSVSDATAVVQGDGVSRKLRVFGGRTFESEIVSFENENKRIENAKDRSEAETNRIEKETTRIETSVIRSPKDDIQNKNKKERLHSDIYCLTDTGKWIRECDVSLNGIDPYPIYGASSAAVGTSSIFLFGGNNGQNISTEKRCQEVLNYNTIGTSCVSIGSIPFSSVSADSVVSWNGQYVFPGGVSGLDSVTEPIRFLVYESTPRFGFLNGSVLTVYMLAMLAVGFYFMRRNRNSDDFFKGGGRLPWWATGISIFATALSAITFLSIPAKAYATDWTMAFYNLGIAFAAPLVICFYLPRFRKLTAQSAYEYLETRFNRPTRWIASFLFCVFMITRIAIVLYLPAITLHVVTGLDVYVCIAAAGLVTLCYCTLGGMEAVVWGDVIQGFLLVGGAIFSLVWLVQESGGVTETFSTAVEYGKLHAFDFSIDWSHPVFWTVLLGGCSGCFITYSSDQTIIQRYISATDDRQTKKSIWLNVFLSLPITVVFFAIGTALFVYFHKHPQELAPNLDNIDSIYPFFIVNRLPSGASGLLIAAIFAAAMSTLSANINSAAAAITSDFLKVLAPNVTAKTEIRRARYSGIFVGCAGTAFAMILATWDIRSLWDQFNTFLGLFTGGLAALFLMGIFTKRANGFGAVTGMLVSALSLFVIQKQTNFSFLLYGLFGMAICFVVGWLVSLLTSVHRS